MNILLGLPIDVGSQLGIGDFFRITSISSLISGTLSLALIFGSLAFILYFAWSAVRWLSSGGDKAVIESARNRMTNAFIGLVLVAAAWAVYILVVYILGLPINIAGTGGS
jgi:hypothetical protein